jgi:small subunit ribosomal protein S7
MSRKILLKRRLNKKDSKYNNLLVNILINKVLRKGKKSIAEYIVYKAFELIELKINKNPIYILEKAVKIVSPRVRLEANYSNKNVYQVPRILNLYYSTNLAIKWIIDSSKKRSGKTMYLKLSNEILDIIKGSGNSIKKRDEMHKKAEANKAFIKF